MIWILDSEIENRWRCRRFTKEEKSISGRLWISNVSTSVNCCKIETKLSTTRKDGPFRLKNFSFLGTIDSNILFTYLDTVVQIIRVSIFSNFGKAGKGELEVTEPKPEDILSNLSCAPTC